MLVRPVVKTGLLWNSGNFGAFPDSSTMQRSLPMGHVQVCWLWSPTRKGHITRAFVIGACQTGKCSGMREGRPALAARPSLMAAVTSPAETDAAQGGTFVHLLTLIPKTSDKIKFQGPKR